MTKFISIAVIIFLPFLITAQEKLTLKESVIGAYAEFYPESVSNLDWVANSHEYFYTVKEDKAEVVYKYDPSKDKATKIMHSTEISELLKKNGGEGIKGFKGLKWTTSNTVIFNSGIVMWEYDVAAKALKKKITFAPDGANHDPSSNYNDVAYTVENNLFVSKNNGKPIAVTKHTDSGIVSGQAIHRYEFGIGKGTFWSPNNNSLAFYEKDESMVTDYHLLDYSSTPGEVNPTKYPMAGQKSHQAKVGVFDMKTDKVIYLNTGELDDHYLTNLTWSPDEKYIYLAEVNRDQNHMKLNRYDAKTGAFIKTLFEEKDKEYVEPEHGPFFLEGADEFLWFSERDGFNHLYRYTSEGELLNQVTKGEFVVKEILNYSLNTGKVIIVGTRKPTEMVAYQVDLKGKKMTTITKEPGVHNVQASHDGKYVIDNYSSVSIPRKISVLDNSGKTVKLIKESDNPLADKIVGTTELYTIKVDEDTDAWCRMIKPSDFDENKKYPVLVYVYGGPHAQMVTDRWLGGASLWMHYMAERGYIIFTLDNRGSANRGIEFEQKIFRNVGEIELIDQLKGVEHLKTLKYIDSDRMAIHGWSYGGFMTTSMMCKYPDVFKVGVAGGPVIDWSLYEVMYTERYMDTPQTNPEGFKRAMVANYAKNLKGDLLLIHGTVDDVVVMQHSMQFLKQCIDDEVQVDFFVYPGHPHNVRGKDRVHLMTKVLNYVEDKLETD